MELDAPGGEVGNHDFAKGVVGGVDGFVEDEGEGCGRGKEALGEECGDGVSGGGREVAEAAFGDEEGWERRVDVGE